jgi:hypothetical protein
MAGHAVPWINLGVFFIPALIIKLKGPHRTILHTAAAPQAFILVNNRILAAGWTKIKKLWQGIKLLSQLIKVRFRSIGVAALCAFFKLVFDLPVQYLSFGPFLLTAFR